MPYPLSYDTFPGTATQGTSQIADSTLDHALQHRVLGSAVGSLEQVVGTTSGTAVLMKFNAGDFASRINSGGTLQQALTGTINNSVLGTPSITGGTLSSIVGTQTGNNLAANWLNVSNGTAVNVGSSSAPTTGQVLTATSGSSATWQTPATSVIGGTSLSGSTTANTMQQATGSIQLVLTRTSNILVTAAVQSYANSGTTESIIYQLTQGTSPSGFGPTMQQNLGTGNLRAVSPVSYFLSTQAAGTYTLGLQFRSQNTNLVTIENGYITAIAI